MKQTHLKTDEYFSWGKFANIIKERKAEYLAGQPFKHIAIDGLFNSQFLDQMVTEFPPTEDQVWDKVNNPEIQVKLRTNWQTEVDIPDTALTAVQIINSGRFLRMLSELTDINGFIPDPYFTGGGLNQIVRGGELAVHVDGNWHDKMGLHRRLNVILYLNREWHEEWAGHFEMWDTELTKCVKMIAPGFNRLVIFETTDFTMHGHPRPLACPQEHSRKSLIQYYYTSSRPAEEVKSTDIKHRALFVRNSELPANSYQQ